MEEKLYFEPADYGKGKKKRDKATHEEKKKHSILKLIGLLLFLAIIIVVIWLLHGKTTTTGRYPENVRNESLICSSNDITYEKVDDVSPISKELQVNLIFYGEQELTSANLKYTMQFSSAYEAKSFEAVAHNQFNIGVQNAGYSAGKFNNKFTVMDNKLVVTLSIPNGKLDDFAKSYYLIPSESNLPMTLKEYKEIYESQGFTCESSIERN